MFTWNQPFLQALSCIRKLRLYTLSAVVVVWFGLWESFTEGYYRFEMGGLSLTMHCELLTGVIHGSRHKAMKPNNLHHFILYFLENWSKQYWIVYWHLDFLKNLFFRNLCLPVSIIKKLKFQPVTYLYNAEPSSYPFKTIWTFFECLGESFVWFTTNCLYWKLHSILSFDN